MKRKLIDLIILLALFCFIGGPVMLMESFLGVSCIDNEDPADTTKRECSFFFKPNGDPNE